ncbi:MAG: anaerobic glycerol-3-phosphate dehydrogenase subunit A [Bacteroidales bacterium]|nr:anaerobic glycerol-3-phosphate dehydrogenase subunit A [Candidatus Cacconaster merdequi]
MSRAILADFEIRVYPRIGYDAAAFCERYNSLPQVKGVTLLDGALHNISSTQIRQNREHYDVIVIGGGVTGAGVARDCALRGLKVLLLEKGDFANGASGRNHGLLHSGARYAVNDAESAAECIRENMILKKIAPHCTESRDGLFITLPEDDLSYQKTFIESCLKSGIKAEAIDPNEARLIEPAVNPALTGAVRVPDGSVDPFRLTMANVVDARAHGAKVLVHKEVTGFIKDSGRIIGVNVRDVDDGGTKAYYAELVVNASGIWGAGIAALAGAKITMFPAKGTLLVFGHRVNNMVINRCRKAADGDILVPGESVTILGTTSTRVPFEEIDDVRPTRDEVELLLSEGTKIVPSLAGTRILRAYSGVRPLVASLDDASGRSISRGIVLIDHEERGEARGLITITGGKLMTYRLMAEMATDLVCKKLSNSKACRTAEEILPNPLVRNARFGGNLVCECENVTEEEIRYAVDNLEAKDLSMLRRRTRVGMGTCQGQLCARKAASMLPSGDGMKHFLQERWKGIVPVAWGDALREAQLTQWLYSDREQL